MTLVSANSDRDLERRVRQFLSDQNYASLGQLGVEVTEGIVVLTGHLSSFYEKQLALSCARRVAEVRRVDDQISVA